MTSLRQGNWPIMWAKLFTRSATKRLFYTNSKNSIVLYTVITNHYDELKEIPEQFIKPYVDYICLTDNSKLRSNTYKIVLLDSTDDPVVTQRRYKILINRYIRSYDISIYIDGKISINGYLYDLLGKLKKHEIIGFRHYKRDCLYKEAAVLLHPYKQLEIKENVIPLIGKIKSSGFPKEYGLTDTSILVRKHSENVIQTMNLWFDLVKKYSRRDQLSFMYCMWTNQVNLEILDHGRSIKYFNKSEHLSLRTINQYWLNSPTPWLECFDPYENRKYFFNCENRLCKWNLDDEYSQEHYKFLENGYKSANLIS